MKPSLLGIALSAAVAFAQVPTGWVNIVSQNSGKCLDMRGGPGAIAQGVVAQQSSCLGSGQTNQIFQLLPAPNGGYEIVADNSGLALEPLNGSTANGTLVEQWPYLTDSYQIWTVSTASTSGYYTLHPESDPTSCMDVNRISKHNGANVQQWACWGGQNQAWNFVPITVMNPLHVVSLTWDASTSSNVTGYNVYRAGPSGSFSKIASGIPATEYADSMVIDGQSYQYATTAVDSSGDESSYSNTVSVTIPSQ